MAASVQVGRADAKSLLDALNDSAELLFGKSALHLAAEDGYTNVAEALLLHGKEANTMDKDGKTPLDLARTEKMRSVLSRKPPQPLPNIESDAMEASRLYILNNHILELFESLTAEVLFHRPEDPKAYLVQRLSAIKGSNNTTAAIEPFFTEANLKTLFSLYDLESKGYLTLDQYHIAMSDLGVTEYDKEPTAGRSGRIDEATYIHLTTKALKSRSFGRPSSPTKAPASGVTGGDKSNGPRGGTTSTGSAAPASSSGVGGVGGSGGSGSRGASGTVSVGGSSSAPRAR